MFRRKAYVIDEPAFIFLVGVRHANFRRGAGQQKYECST